MVRELQNSEMKMETSQTERTSFPDAVKTVLKVLGRGEVFSITHLAKEAGLNRRTTEKVLDLLEDIQKVFPEKHLDITQLKRAKIVQFEERPGLLGLPEDIQKLIIRTSYFPTPTREQETLVYLFQNKAYSLETAARMEHTELLEKLKKQGQILETANGEFYLSEEGQIVVEGTLKLYPELKNIVNQRQK